MGWKFINGLEWDLVFFFNDTATTEIYTLSLHDALPIWRPRRVAAQGVRELVAGLVLAGRVVLQDLTDARDGLGEPGDRLTQADRKSTRLNSSHTVTSYAVFCLKKKTI